MAAGNKAHKLIGAGAATLIAEPALAMAHQGGLGIIVGLVIGAVAYGIVDEVEQRTGGQLALPGRNQSLATEKAALEASGQSKPTLAHRLLVGKSVREAEAAEADDTTVVPEEERETTAPDDDDEVETAFTHTTAQQELPGIPRITIEQMVAHTERNSYEVYIGRSLTRPGNPAVKIDFYKRHLKLIGASQHGKSSEAAAILEAILRTHDPKHVQVALLDLENKTSRLFEDAPHVLKMKVDGEIVRFHARSYDEVLKHLEYLCSIVDHRYTLSEEELERLPLIIAYIEEFVDLKNYFKQRISMVSAEEREQARASYTKLIYCLKKLAARGLKVLVQLLMCAQVDYRDEDLQEALVNVTAGMSFCVRVSAAQAAGFYRSDLLTRNVREDQVGQAVVQMAECNDLILAPDYDLKARLRALPPVVRERETPASLPVMEATIPAITQKPARANTDLERALRAFDEGYTTINAMAIALDITPWNVRPLYTQVKMIREKVG